MEYNVSDSMTNDRVKQEFKPKLFVELREDEDGHFHAAAGYNEVPAPLSLKEYKKTVTRWEEEQLHKNHSVQWPAGYRDRAPCKDWTDALEGMPIHELSGQPSRLLNVRTKQLVHPEKPVRFAAVSYVWSQWEGGDSEKGDEDQRLNGMLEKLEHLMLPRGLEYVWIDQRCIDQESIADKETETKKMGDYYAQAAITFVMVPEWSATYTWEMTGFIMAKEEVVKAARDVEELSRTKWASRVWTFQEAMLSNRIVFVGKGGAKSAADLAVASTLLCASEDAYAYVYADWQTSCPVRLVSAAGGAWRRVLDRDHTKTQVMVSNKPLSTMSKPVPATPILKDSKILTDIMLYPKTHRYLNEMWKLAGERHCTFDEDRVYGMLGLIQGADKIAVIPGVGFEEAVIQAANAGMVSFGILAAKSGSPKPGRSWCPQPGTESKFKHDATWVEYKHLPIRLTPEGLCRLQGVRFRFPRKPQPHETEWTSYKLDTLDCNTLKTGKRLNLTFRDHVPEGEGWKGNWFAAVEQDTRYWPKRTMLIQYEDLHEGVLRKLQGLEVDSVYQHFSEDEDVEHFLIG